MTRGTTLFERILMKLRANRAHLPPGLTAAEIERALQGDAGALQLLTPKHIVSFANPSYLVQGGTCTPPHHSRWRALFDRHKRTIDHAIATVGRFEAPEFGSESHGTGWLVRPDVVATAAHVVERYKDRINTGSFAMRIDFLGEHGSPVNRERRVVEHLASSAAPDLAFLRIDDCGEPLPAPIELARETDGDDPVCLIGYPADGTSFYPDDKIEAMFAGIFDVKRVSPGKLTEVADDRLEHDCTSLGGNSGSLILELPAGKVVGLNFGGNLVGPVNWAVPSWVIHERLEALGL